MKKLIYSKKISLVHSSKVQNIKYFQERKQENDGINN